MMTSLPRRAACLVAGLALALVVWARWQPEAVQAQPRVPAAGAMATADEVAARCGTACHLLPTPDILPRATWRDELVRMQLIMDGVPEPAGAMSRAAVMIPLPPDMLRLLRYFEAHAPERLSAPEAWPPAEGGPVRFEKTDLRIRGFERPQAFATANVQFADVDGSGRIRIIATDMRAGLVLVGDLGGPLVPVADVPHPARVSVVDLDRDGRRDLLVSDLGSFLPADHSAGTVQWLRRQADGHYQAVTIADGLGRVADARAADLDGDGDLDIVAAVFGWRKTGSLMLFENRTTDWARPQFVGRVLDARTGALDAQFVDLDGNGTPDIVALLAQEHETVVALLNDGTGRFVTHDIYRAPHPNWGSSGIEVVDFDGDRRLDVLLTHGDTFDDFVVKPYHGVTLLTNPGRFPFEATTLAALPGALRAVPVDVDGDGDLDVVAAAMVAGGGGEMQDRLPGLVWLEQRPARTFLRHTIVPGRPFYSTLDAFRDEAGRLHIAAGTFAFDTPLETAVEVWTTAARPGSAAGGRSQDREARRPAVERAP